MAETRDLSWRPPHAYQPGRTARHDEALFDPCKADAGGEGAVHERRAWAFATAFHRDGFHWEAHEVFEALWMACPPNSPEKLYVQALIQRANAALKREMGQARAAARLTAQAEGLAAEAFTRACGTVCGASREDWDSGS